MDNNNFPFKLLFLILLIFTISNLTAQKLYSSNDDWSVEVYYIEPGTVNLYSSPSENSKIVGTYYYLDKILVLHSNSEYVKFGWEKVVFPKEGYLKNEYLITTKEKIALDKKFKNNPDKIDSSQNWQPKIITCGKEYTFIKSGTDFNTDNIGIIKEDDNALAIATDELTSKEWIQIFYPKDGFVFGKDFELVPNNFLLGIGGSYGFYNLPYEKNMSNYKNPIGGFIDFSRTTWNFLFRFGYQHAETNLAEYILKNDIFYLQIQYSLLRFINNHFRIYALAGGGFWNSKFRFTKYPELTDYFPEEKASGFGYYLGGGIEYSLSGFFIGVQYSFFGTEEATFGPDAQPGEFTNQYKLFIGSNQVEVDLGYRFEL